jgi:hypothetical protein
LHGRSAIELGESRIMGRRSAPGQRRLCHRTRGMAAFRSTTDQSTRVAAPPLCADTVAKVFWAPNAQD